jgi:hypothetical protein
MGRVTRRNFGAIGNGCVVVKSRNIVSEPQAL